MRYRIGICEDDRIICKEIEEKIHSCFRGRKESVSVIVWNTGEDCIAALSEKGVVNILFLDIELPGCSGVNVGNHIRKEIKDRNMYIIYVSQYTKYAMELFETHPYYFIDKSKGFSKIQEIIDDLITLDMEDSQNYMYASSGIIYKLMFRDIMYLESDKKYIKIILEDGTERRFIGTLKNEMKKLSDMFAAAGQSYIVNLKYIEKFYPDKVVMMNGQCINIGRKYKHEFYERNRKFTDYMK